MNSRLNSHFELISCSQSVCVFAAGPCKINVALFRTHDVSFIYYNLQVEVLVLEYIILAGSGTIVMPLDLDNSRHYSWLFFTGTGVYIFCFLHIYVKSNIVKGGN